MKPTRDGAAGRAYLDLQAQARTTKRPVDELLHLYVLEGFLERLSRSSERANLVLKGEYFLPHSETGGLPVTSICRPGNWTTTLATSGK